MKGKKFCLFLIMTMLLPTSFAFAERIRILDQTTGKVKIYDTDTKKILDPTPEEEKLAKEEEKSGNKPSLPPKEESSKMPKLPYSELPVGDQDTVRAIKGEGYAVEGSNFALNGAAKVHVEKNTVGKEEIQIVDKEGNKIKSKGLVYVYMYVSPYVSRPFKVKVDGIYTQFADVAGTSYVRFASEF